jgi:butyrate kinase
MPHLILAVNPGSTTTKIGLFKDDDAVFMKTIEHNPEELALFADLPSQREFRLGFVLEALAESGYKVQDLSGVVGRGGLMPVIETGGYVVNDVMKEWISAEKGGSHASNLGSLLADLVASQAGCKAYIYDSVTAGALPEIAAVTGFAEIRRKNLSHVLNSRAQSIKYASKVGKKFEDLNIITVHMGGGISISIYEKGVLKDSAADDSGPFSPERSGMAPLMAFVDAFYESGLSQKDLKKKIRGGGGLMAHLGTTDFRKIEADALGEGENGCKKSRLMIDAMAYNIAKFIGSMSVAVNGLVDVIILTGGLARSANFVSKISKRVSFIAPIEVMPGEYELEALAAGCLRIIKGEEKAKELIDIVDGFGICR